MSKTVLLDVFQRLETFTKASSEYLGGLKKHLENFNDEELKDLNQRFKDQVFGSPNKKSSEPTESE